MENVMAGLFVCSLVWEKHERRPKSDLVRTLFNFSASGHASACVLQHLAVL